MKILFGLLTLGIMAGVVVCAYQANRVNHKMARVVYRYEVLVFCCAVAFMGYTYLPGIAVKTLCKGLVLALFDWVLYLLMEYTQLYTGLYQSIGVIQLVMMVYNVFDTVVLVANTWIHNMFTITDVGTDTITCVYNAESWLYKGHFLYSYVIIILLLLSYAVEICRTSKFYRRRYIVIFAVLFLSFATDLATIDSQSIYDFPMLAYAVMSILIYYFTFRYVPNALVENTLSLVVRDLNSGIMCFDNDGRCAYANGVIRKMYDVEGNTTALFESHYKQWLWKKGDERQDSMTIEDTFEDRQGNEKTYEVVYKRIYDKKGHMICDYFVASDRTEEIQSLKREQFKATHDSLTKLLNREAFYAQAAEMMKENPDAEYTLMCTNIKDFKFVNEIFGIQRGDEILQKEANLLRAIAPLDGLCARLRGDRFAVIALKEKFNEDAWRDVTKQMQQGFDNNTFKLHVYAGVYHVDDVEEPVSIMCDKATLASELVKDDYHDCVAYYNKDILEKSIEERRIIAEFDRALGNEEFVMFLQPQCDGEGKAHGAEALVRWQHPSRGLLSPFFFIDILEKAGLVYKLDRYIWTKAAQQLAKWKNTENGDYHISVNISTKDFYLLDLYETFVELVNEYGIEPEKLKLEITETALMTDFNKTMEVIRRLQNYGFKIEIDDFGSGYSSLNMLKDISADILKIDMGFLRASENEVKGRDILETIIELAQKLGMQVITEGVETKKQLDMLNSMGCGMYQGYYFSKPIPVEEFEKKFM